MFNKHDKQNLKEWIKDTWWKLKYADTMLAYIIVGSFLITFSGITYWVVK